MTQIPNEEIHVCAPATQNQKNEAVVFSASEHQILNVNILAEDVEQVVH